MDATDLGLLGRLQAGFPLEPRPFAALGDLLGLSEAEVLERVSRLRRQGLIRRIGPVIDPEKAGRVGALAAMAVPEGLVEAVAAAVSVYPTVTHNYQRVPLAGSCPYNLWFTLTAPTQEALDEAVAAIGKATGLPVTVLPARRKFKIGVRFQFSHEGESARGHNPHPSPLPERERGQVGPNPPPSQGGGRGRVVRPPQSPSPTLTLPSPWKGEGSGHSPPSQGGGGGRAGRPLDPVDLRILRELQDGLPLVAEPYGEVAARLGMPVEALLERLAAMLERGEVRRFGVSIAHRKAGFAANVMCVWRVPDEQVDAFAREAVRLDAITHCYERATTPEWPYNVYAMFHGRTQSDCEAVIRDLCQRTGQTDYVALLSTREFKKTWTRL